MPIVKEEEIGPCEGVAVSALAAAEIGIPESVRQCDSKFPERIKGYDDKWRCPQCNRIHMELVFAEIKPPVPERHEKTHRENMQDETEFVLKAARRRDHEQRRGGEGLVDRLGRPVKSRKKPRAN